MTLEQTDRDAFRLAVQTILEADTIYVVGVRSCAPLASFLGYYLNQIFGSVRLVTTSGATEVYDCLLYTSFTAAGAAYGMRCRSVEMLK